VTASPAVLARVLVPFGLGYFLSFLARNVNAVIGPELTRALGLDAAALGLLTSAYFLGFAAFQIPLGVLLDRYGPRLVEAVLLLVAGAGALLFAYGQSLATLALGRTLIGVGVSSCLMAAFKANVLWWPRERLAFANGCVLAFGGLGALAATAPVQAALAYTDWRGLFLLLAVATVAVAAIIFAVVPEAPRRPVSESWGAALREALAVFAQPVFWRVVPLGILMQSIFLSYHGLWAAAWLADVNGVERADIGGTLALATIGLILGTFGLGAVADRLGRSGVPVLSVLMASAVAFMLVQVALISNLPAPEALVWGAFIFFGSAGTLSYAALSQLYPAHLSGRVATAYNMLVFVVAFLMQWLIGVALRSWSSPDGAAPAAAHASVLAGLLVLEAAALLWLLTGRRLLVPRAA
jgi:MFS family permease